MDQETELKLRRLAAALDTQTSQNSQKFRQVSHKFRSIEEQLRKLEAKLPAPKEVKKIGPKKL